MCLQVPHKQIRMCVFKIYWSCCAKWHRLSLFFRAFMKMAWFFRCSTTMHFTVVLQTCFIWKLLFLIFFIFNSAISMGKIVFFADKISILQTFVNSNAIVANCIAAVALLFCCCFYSFISVACRIFDDCQHCCPSHRPTAHLSVNDNLYLCISLKYSRELENCNNKNTNNRTNCTCNSLLHFNAYLSATFAPHKFLGSTKNTFSPFLYRKHTNSYIHIYFTNKLAFILFRTVVATYRQHMA